MDLIEAEINKVNDKIDKVESEIAEVVQLFNTDLTPEKVNQFGIRENQLRE